MSVSCTITMEMGIFRLSLLGASLMSGCCSAVGLH